MDERFMHEAIRLAVESVQTGQGGPFGAVVVRDGEIVGRGTNRVTALCDPTAHAEVQAIRDACNRLGEFHLAGCDIYVSCLPCPMCVGAIYWAHIERVFFAAPGEAAAAVGFDDVFIAEQLSRPAHERSMPMIQMLPEAGLEPLSLWEQAGDKIRY